MRVFPCLLFLSVLAFACTHEGEDVPPVVEVEPEPETPADETVPSPKPPVPMAPPLPSAPAGKPPLASEKPGETLQVTRELPKPVEIMLKSAEAQLRKKQLSVARAQAERAYRMENQDPRISFLLGRIAAEEGNYQDAEQWGLRALENAETEANKALLWRFIARCRQKQGDGKGAESALRRQR